MNLFEQLAFNLSHKEKICFICDGNYWGSLKKKDIPNFPINQQLSSTITYFENSFNITHDRDILRKKNILFFKKNYSNILNEIPTSTFGEISQSVLIISSLYDKFFPNYKKDSQTNLTNNFIDSLKEHQITSIKSNGIKTSQLDPDQKQILWNIAIQTYLENSAINVDKKIYNRLKNYEIRGQIVLEETLNLSPTNLGVLLDNTSVILIRIPKGSKTKFRPLDAEDIAYQNIVTNNSLEYLTKKLPSQGTRFKYSFSDSIKEKQYVIFGFEYSTTDNIVSTIKTNERWKFSHRNNEIIVDTDNVRPKNYEIADINRIAISMLPESILRYTGIGNILDANKIKDRIFINLFNNVETLINSCFIRAVIENKYTFFSDLPPYCKSLVALKLLQNRIDALYHVNEYTPAYLANFDSATVNGQWLQDDSGRSFRLTLTGLDPIKQRGDRFEILVSTSRR